VVLIVIIVLLKVPATTVIVAHFVEVPALRERHHRKSHREDGSEGDRGIHMLSQLHREDGKRTETLL